MCRRFKGTVTKRNNEVIGNYGNHSGNRRTGGVSRGTVDRVLNHRGSVNAATAALVNDIAKNWTTSQTAPGSPWPHSER